MPTTHNPRNHTRRLILSIKVFVQLRVKERSSFGKCGTVEPELFSDRGVEQSGPYPIESSCARAKGRRVRGTREERVRINAPAPIAGRERIGRGSDGFRAQRHRSGVSSRRIG
jgi:hypothetical protein